ncbi:MAG: HEAT repeat domain-containing protein [Myxococcales bacterium]|nr:HEAT repeat domain-containing protein [Myxococcales bacterium]
MSVTRTAAELPESASGTSAEVRTVPALSGALGVGEVLPPFVTSAQLSRDKRLRRGLARLARNRPTAGLLADLARDPALGATALIAALWHENPNVRAQCYRLLHHGKPGGSALITAMRRTLRQDPDRDVRAAAALALVSLPTPALVPLLVKLLRRDGAASVRANAAHALGSQADAAVVPVLIAALKDDDTWVRLRAISSLRRLRAHSAVASLEAILSDPDGRVRKATTRTLKALTGKAYRERTPN